MNDVVCADAQTQTQPFVKILSIGGTGVFGMNCLLLQTPQERLLIDCGVLFPADDDFGVDLITPDFSVFEANPPHALLVTHAHEDHVGAIPYLLMALKKAGMKHKLPIYASDITVAFIRRRLLEHDLENSVDFHIVSPKYAVQLGDIHVEFIDVCHSIPGSLAFAFDTPCGKIVHSGDWRIDNTRCVVLPADETRKETSKRRYYRVCGSRHSTGMGRSNSNTWIY